MAELITMYQYYYLITYIAKNAIIHAINLFTTINIQTN